MEMWRHEKTGRVVWQPTQPGPGWYLVPTTTCPRCGVHRVNELFNGLTAMVQYRRKDSGHGWKTLAAFDSQGQAEIYVNRCSSKTRPW